MSFIKGEKGMDSNDFNRFLKEMVTKEFFTNICDFTKEERVQKEDWIALVKGMLLLDADSESEWESKDISDALLIDYLVWVRENNDTCKRNTIRSVVEYLEAAFVNHPKRIKKEWIPKLMYLAEKAMYEEVKPSDFRNVICTMNIEENQHGIDTKVKTGSKRFQGRECR